MKNTILTLSGTGASTEIDIDKLIKRLKTLKKKGNNIVLFHVKSEYKGKDFWGTQQTSATVDIIAGIQ